MGCGASKTQHVEVVGADEQQHVDGKQPDKVRLHTYTLTGAATRRPIAVPYAQVSNASQPAVRERVPTHEGGSSLHIPDLAAQAEKAALMIQGLFKGRFGAQGLRESKPGSARERDSTNAAHALEELYRTCARTHESARWWQRHAHITLLHSRQSRPTRAAFDRTKCPSGSSCRSQLKLEFEGEPARRLREREPHILPVLNQLFDGCSKVKVWLVWQRQDGFGVPKWASGAPKQVCSLLLLTQGFSASGYSEEPTMTRIDAAQARSAPDARRQPRTESRNPPRGKR